MLPRCDIPAARTLSNDPDPCIEYREFKEFKDADEPMEAE
jgi:hypothetical protein